MNARIHTDVQERQIGSAVFSEDETVFNDDFENGTVVDEHTGEVFGFGV